MTRHTVHLPEIFTQVNLFQGWSTLVATKTEFGVTNLEQPIIGRPVGVMTGITLAPGVRRVRVSIVFFGLLMTIKTPLTALFSHQPGISGSVCRMTYATLPLPHRLVEKFAL